MAKNNSQIFLMPVLPAVKQYLKYSHIGSPYVATKQSYLGTWLINALSLKSHRMKSWNWDECKAAGFTEGWKYSIPVRYYHRCVLPEARVHDFNHMIMKMIHVEIIQDIEQRALLGNTEIVMPAIEAFWEKYEIWDYDLPDETIRKMYYRYRKNIDKKGKEPLSSLILEAIK